ncbi:membrane protein [Agrobacterium tumefaciens]|uniref:Membrane protein n=1 Tax=Agrobacterium tumefaciens TaxID=358 RepID=A0A0D0K042_AGRTU|nr:membrane protein [Agrobacterium tumefaciens]
MTRTNNLYLIIGALIIAVVGLGIYAWNEETKPKGIEMNIGPSGVSVQEN